GDSNLAVSVVNANIDGCLGCGYCNIGCRFGHKLSMLETTLPWAQKRFGAEKVRIYADCEVRKIVAGDGRARAVKGKLRDGRALTGGPAVNYVPTSGDLRKLADGLTELGQILFEGGAKALMLNGWDFYRFTSPAALAELPSILSDPSMVTLGTGHPQGGNALG